MPDAHFNALTPAEHERLSLLVEECGEVLQVAGKVLRHGYESKHPDGGPTNRDLLAMEIGDVQTAIRLLSKAADVSQAKIDERLRAKPAKLARYLHHAAV